MDIKHRLSMAASEPFKWLAVLIVVLSSLFLVMTWLPLFQKNTLFEDTSPTVVEPVTEEVITTKSSLFTRSLFGEYIPTSESNIKQSSLDVVLVGIMYSGDNGPSQVLIKGSDGEEHVYAIGDSLPGGAIIKKINKDSVIVLYKGVLERLLLPKEELHFEEPSKPLFGE